MTDPPATTSAVIARLARARTLAPRGEQVLNAEARDGSWRERAVIAAR